LQRVVEECAGSDHTPDEENGHADDKRPRPRSDWQFPRLGVQKVALLDELLKQLLLLGPLPVKEFLQRVARAMRPRWLGRESTG
jgi:hypothetical protein